jgi:hypothetical protein
VESPASLEQPASSARRTMRSDPSTRKKFFNFFVAPGKVKKHIFLSEYLADLSSNLKPRENTFEIKNKRKKGIKFFRKKL